jgi:hypothetical protein
MRPNASFANDLTHRPAAWPPCWRSSSSASEAQYRSRLNASGRRAPERLRWVTGRRRNSREGDSQSRRRAERAEACFHYFVVPGGRPALQLELVIHRQQFRLVKHNDLRCRGGCIRPCSWLAAPRSARRVPMFALLVDLSLTHPLQVRNLCLIAEGFTIRCGEHSSHETTLPLLAVTAGASDKRDGSQACGRPSRMSSTRDACPLGYTWPSPPLLTDPASLYLHQASPIA